LEEEKEKGAFARRGKRGGEPVSGQIKKEYGKQIQNAAGSSAVDGPWFYHLGERWGSPLVPLNNKSKSTSRIVPTKS